MNSATPLIVLDGVEISKADLNALDPEVIESFSVLKDATASAMYGTRGRMVYLSLKPSRVPTLKNRLSVCV